ncbi:hypothetical protein AaE_003885 [Aphanomyces astaci]|uniref:Uncharacterized protein n=1 Tax=Aphanomyces astaci TaxID=112090 RepID=A0A6A5AR65_APHAT|nr:hypothetical protein AaE_003885 [Aphanomyces astaci]
MGFARGHAKLADELKALKLRLGRLDHRHVPKDRGQIRTPARRRALPAPRTSDAPSRRPLYRPSSPPRAWGTIADMTPQPSIDSHIDAMVAIAWKALLSTYTLATLNILDWQLIYRVRKVPGLNALLRLLG